MKILRIVSSGFEEGGVENGIVTTNPLLKSLGCEVRVMASDRRMEMPRFDDYNFKAISSFNIGKYLFHIFHPYSFFLLKKILKKYKPDLIVLHTMAEVSPSVLFALKKTPAIMMVHGPEEYTKSLINWYLPTSDFKSHSHEIKDLTIYGWLHYLYIKYITRFVYLLGMRNIDVVVTLSNYMHRLVKSDGIDNVYIPNGAVLLNEKPLPTKRIVSYVGRVEKYKGVDVLVRAIPNIIKNYPEIEFFIVGDGSYKKTLEKMILDLNISKNVKLLGHLSRDLVKKVYEDSLIIVIPSIWPEAFGKVGIEAMSVGRPIIATNVGGVSDWLIDGKTGYLIEPNNPKEISDKVSKLLSRPDILEEMSVESKKRAKDFSLEKHVKNILDLYEKVIKKNI